MRVTGICIVCAVALALTVTARNRLTAGAVIFSALFLIGQIAVAP